MLQLSGHLLRIPHAERWGVRGRGGALGPQSGSSTPPLQPQPGMSSRASHHADEKGVVQPSSSELFLLQARTHSPSRGTPEGPQVPGKVPCTYHPLKLCLDPQSQLLKSAHPKVLQQPHHFHARPSKQTEEWEGTNGNKSSPGSKFVGQPQLCGRATGHTTHLV